MTISVSAAPGAPTLRSGTAEIPTHPRLISAILGAVDTLTPSPPSLEKSVWTDEDLEDLGFHDVHVVAMAPRDLLERGPSRFALDIDYIVQWVHPAPPEPHFSFWICPATLVFDEVYALSGELDLDLSIDCITRLGTDLGRGWHVQGHQFELQLITEGGFTLYLRRPPILAGRQLLTWAERGGVSFEESGFPGNG